MGVLKKRRIAVIATVVLALMLGGAGMAVAGTTARTGTTVARTAILTQDAFAVYAGGTFTTIGSSSIFAGAGSILLVTFSAESACYGGSGWCSVRILVDGAEAAPVTGLDFAFDSTNAGAESSASWESHSMQRTRTVTSTIAHSVVVQVAQVGAGVTARYDDWTLTTMAIAP